MNITEEIFEGMRAHPLGQKLQFPPNCHFEMGTSFLEYKPGESLKISVPIKEAFNNPAHTTFGGYYGVFFDLAFGPFSFLETKQYTTSLDLNIAFLKPLTAKDEEVIVLATFSSKSKSFIMMEGKAFKKDGTLVATATSRMMVLKM